MEKLKNLKYIVLAIAFSVSIPMALGALGDESEKIKQHRDTTLDGVHNLAQEACHWQIEYIKIRVKEESNPDKMIELANHLKRVQVDCMGWVQEQVFIKSEKTKN